MSDLALIRQHAHEISLNYSAKDVKSFISNDCFELVGINKFQSLMAVKIALKKLGAN